MNKINKYYFSGIFFATVIESINMGILGRNWFGMFFTILTVYSAFILLGYILRKSKLSTHFLIMGSIGLIVIEWTLVGTKPNLNNSLFSSLIFQIGMFLYWATVGFAPRLLLDERVDFISLQKGFTRFYLVWFGGIYLVGVLLLSNNARYVFMQTGSAVGHILLSKFFISYLRKYPRN